MTALVTKRYDLTTKAGWRAAAGEGALAFAAWWIAGPIGVAAYFLYKYLSPEKEVEAVQSIIRTARQSGVSEVRIRISKGAKARIGSHIEGYPVEVSGEFGNSIEIHVVFNNTAAS